MMTLEQFIQNESVSLTIVSGPKLDKDADGWEHNAYDVELRTPNGSMPVAWRQGVALKDAPRVIDVLDAVRLDASVTEFGSFEDWCSDFGYDSDSRKAEAIYEACKTQTAELQRIMGATFNVLMDDVEEC